MPERGSVKNLGKSNVSVLITKEDTYKIASRVHSMVVKLKPQDTEKIKIIVDMVEKCLDIDKVIAGLPVDEIRLASRAPMPTPEAPPKPVLPRPAEGIGGPEFAKA